MRYHDTVRRITGPCSSVCLAESADGTGIVPGYEPYHTAGPANHWSLSAGDVDRRVFPVDGAGVGPANRPVVP